MTHPTQKDFWFLPLGGSGEIGMNLNLYGHDDQWIMLDLGITFGDRHGIDIITPDPDFITERREKLVGLVLTHAHEDHVGAVPYLWPELQCPIYATPFTAQVVRQKIAEYPWAAQVPIHEVALNSRLEVGKFQIEFISLTHSIPEPNAIAITTPLGTVMHTGDWKIDPTPLVGAPTNSQRLKEWGDQGVLAMVCDSTNVFSEGTSGSEEAVRDELYELLGKYSRNRLVFSCFSSNLARVQTGVMMAQKTNRRVCVVGRSLNRMIYAAKQTGYLKEVGEFIDETTAMSLPPEEVMIICTGSQGEPRSALARMAADQNPYLKLDHRDVVLFSSRVIPGNERAISALQNNLARKGIKIITSHEEDIHVSGHPARDELRQMYQWVRPHVLIPVHGEFRHMQEHGVFGKSCGIEKVVVPENGTLIRLEVDNPRIIDQVPVGRLGYDGNRMVPMHSFLLKDRAKLSLEGSAMITLILDKSGKMVKSPLVSLVGVALEGEERSKVEREVISSLRRLMNQRTKGHEGLQSEVRSTVRRVTAHLMNKRPMITVHVVHAA